MLSAGSWKKNQPNTILFVLIDANGDEVTDLGTNFTVQLSKAGAAFAASAGTKAEVGLGWYSYTSTAGEADTSGPVAIVVTGSGVVQQNLEYVVEDRVLTAVEYTYTVTSTADNSPIEGVTVLFYADNSLTELAWSGETDAFGVARDIYGALPRLEPGTYYIVRIRNGYVFNNPDQENISA